MPSPFPGMDPFLESPAVFPDFHHRLAVEVSRRLNRVLPATYVTRLGHRVVTDELDEDEVRVLIPDVAVTRIPPAGAPERDHATTVVAGSAPVSVVMALPVPTKQFYVEVRQAGADRLVTAIEIVSRSNKLAGSEDEEAFHRKRSHYLASGVHYVEFDLLRAGRRWVAARTEPVAAYRILVSAVPARPRADLWPLALADPLPEIAIPLLSSDAPVPLHLGECFRSLYDEAAYERMLDYSRPVPKPALTAGDAETARRFLAARAP